MEKVESLEQAARPRDRLFVVEHKLYGEWRVHISYFISNLCSVVQREIERLAKDWPDAQWRVGVLISEDFAAERERQVWAEAAKIGEGFDGNCNYDVACLVNQRIATALRARGEQVK